MFPTDTTYDEAARYLLLKAGEWLVVWLLRLAPGHIRFDGWANSVLTLPRTKERVCDGVARLADLSQGGLPVACFLEVETKPDLDMPFRLLLAGGLCGLTARPTNLPGDRFALAAIVLNLTGKGKSNLHCLLGSAEWLLKPQEWNLEDLDAAFVLEEIQAGRIPRELLPFVPPMQKGGDPAIIQRWLEIAGKETDLVKRGDLSLAVVFANAVDRQDLWKEALEGFDMMESSIVNEWKAEAARKGEVKGKLEGERFGKAEALILVLQTRAGEPPAELEAAIRACEKPEKLNEWLAVASVAGTLDEFRSKTGL